MSADEHELLIPTPNKHLVQTTSGVNTGLLDYSVLRETFCNGWSKNYEGKLCQQLSMVIP